MIRFMLSALAITAMLFSVNIVSGQVPDIRDRPLFPKRPPPKDKIKISDIEGVSKTIPNVPEYSWWYGCSPTAGGMIIGWWDAQPGCEALFDGSAATWYGNGNSGTKRMVASQAHIDAGADLGFQYGSWRNHTADCIADFFYTENGGTSRSDIRPGFENFCAWDDPTTTNNESYTATAATKYVAAGWTYNDYCAEIDAGRPVHLGLTSVSGGHSVAGVGYDNSDGKTNYICWTTWGGWGQRSWGWNGETESGYNFRVYAATYLTVTPRIVTNLILYIRDVCRPIDSRCVLEWGPSESNKLYSLFRSTNLVGQDFVCVASNCVATPPLNVYTDVVTGLDRAFYRVVGESEDLRPAARRTVPAKNPRPKDKASKKAK